MRQTREVRSGGSYLSHNDFRAHFGLGRAEKIEAVEVRWPSGPCRNLPGARDPAAITSLQEGEGAAED